MILSNVTLPSLTLSASSNVFYIPEVVFLIVAGGGGGGEEKVQNDDDEDKNQKVREEQTQETSKPPILWMHSWREATGDKQYRE